ncbi:bifunctional adenosylcobinamide kinase/adenosylcobinamide-phosphate guanylyltransferase [Skermania sp. ID1734]|uniref:bifunctional adenosylcobinamide kinase/adenosylcobinamide-phosphate guanylyltransferase n=1 Tax=Skermania sp. ID1734 TaxID=2597516 RepID=UPI00117CD99B|nr:bifunctional adenosylcobinamide kinase/adenosylcobinamide-phosphate guanylyltransferase [Skermania sp. ID1734]TSE01173.1 bifunctional adenosylcobinamide kinase/adenosylcobinamide-phosphate guanylyltransferase [Skermania sp. ID1734]
MRTLVLGGARSGKSAHAESLLGAVPVRYVATARPDPADTDFADRICAHRARRPANWVTLDDVDPVAVLAEPGPAILLDDVGTWLTGQLDAADAWTRPRGTVQTHKLCDAVAACPSRLVVVSPEVGLGVVPASASGRLFRDELGTLNQQLARVCDEVLFVVAGLASRLK